MKIRRRSTSLPSVDQLAKAGIRTSDVIASSVDPGANWVVATGSGMAFLSADSIETFDWTDIDRVTRDQETGELTIFWNTGKAPTQLPLGHDQKRLASIIHERVTASVVTAEHVTLKQGKAHVAIRRRPDGELFSQVTGVGPVDLTDTETSLAIDTVESRLREAAGLTS